MPPLSVTSTAVALDPIAAGKAAWGRIQAASKMMREDWRLVGEALLVGRNKFTTASGGLNKKGFGRWCRENGFGDIEPRTRTDAIWLAEELNRKEFPISEDLHHPVAIRAAYNAALAGTTETDEDEEADTAPAALPPPPAPAVQAVQAIQAIQAAANIGSL